MKTTEVYNENNIIKTESGETTKVETTKVENKGRYVAASLAGLVTSGGFVAFAFQEDVTGDVAGGGDTSTDNSGVETAEKSAFEQAFATARVEKGIGDIFEYEGNYYGTYYKDEWDALSKEEKDEFYASVNSKIQANATDETDTAENALLPEEAAGAQVEVIRMASQVTDDMPQEMALYVAREEVGPGNIYKWNEDVYSTYTADELLELSPEEIERVRYIMEQVNLSEQTLTKADIQGEETILDPQPLIADTEVADTEVTDTEVADTEIADTEVADTEVTDTEIADTEVTDAEITNMEAIVNTADADTDVNTDVDAVANVDVLADVDTAGEQIDYYEDENEGEESINTQETEGGDEIEYVVKVKLPLLSSSDDDVYDDSQALESSDADADTDFNNQINELNNDMNLADNL
ncbi:MAG: hypothetical protein LBL58_14505 [Tannerellaceae bacterium]|jgi:hypothetical protein|nr:hypothetical protein [Tannerellaceae bacterium]